MCSRSLTRQNETAIEVLQSTFRTTSQQGTENTAFSSQMHARTHTHTHTGALAVEDSILQWPPGLTTAEEPELIKKLGALALAILYLQPISVIMPNAPHDGNNKKTHAHMHTHKNTHTHRYYAQTRLAKWMEAYNANTHTRHYSNNHHHHHFPLRKKSVYFLVQTLTQTKMYAFARAVLPELCFTGCFFKK